MKRVIFATLAVVMLLWAASAIAAKPAVKTQEKSAAPAVTAPAAKSSEQAKQEKDALIANINSLRNQELRVAVLQQVLNEEVAKLRNVQAVFCDQYGLDIEKFRKGVYRYDEKEGKFVES